MEPVRRHSCHVSESGRVQPVERELLAEEPLTIQLGGQPLATLMRTPGNEAEMAMGYLLSEGLVRSPDEVATIEFCQAADKGNVVQVRLADERGQAAAPAYRRVFSSCSICGR